MRNKNHNIEFNTENAYEFYMKRLQNALYKSDKEKGNQMERYMKYSVLFNPEDVDYTKKELEEKLQKARELEYTILRQLEEKKHERKI